MKDIHGIEVQPVTTAADISPEAVESLCNFLERRTAMAKEVDAAVALRALAAERESLQAACRQWKEQFDAKDAALQQARASLTARDEAASKLKDWLLGECGPVTDTWDSGYDAAIRAVLRQLEKANGTV